MGCGNENGEGGGACGAGLASWDEERRLVGDPVDVVTGAERHLETDFRLPGAAVPMMWVRTYDSRHARVDRGLGFGFRFAFDVELRVDLDGMTFTDGRGVEIAFPFVTDVGQSTLRQGYRLECVAPQRYRVHRPAQAPSFELAFTRSSDVARLVALVDARGQSDRFVYDPAGLAAVELGRLGRLQIERNGARMAGVSLVGADGQKQRMARYGYDHRGYLVEVENAYGHVRRFEYDQAGRMSRQIDRRGYSFYYDYDSQSRCIRSRGEDGVSDFRFDYQPDARLTVVTRSDGAIWRYYYDEQGSIVQTIDAYGGLTAYVKDEQGRVVREIDPNQNESEILYDDFGVAYARRDPLGHERRLPIDPRPHPLSHTLPTTPAAWEMGRLCRPAKAGRRAPLENLWSASPQGLAGFPLDPALSPPQVEKDVQGRCLREVAATGKARNIGYGPNSYQSWSTDFEGRLTQNDYSSWNHLVRVEKPGKRVVDMTYTVGEQLATVTDGGGARSEYRYDLKDRLIEVRRHGRVREKYRYDAADNLVEKVDGDDRPLLKLVIGPGNRVKQRILASGEVRDYARDEQGYLLGVKNPAGDCRFTHERGRRTSDLRDGVGVVHERSGAGRTTTVLGRFVVRYSSPAFGVTVIQDPADQVQRIRTVGPGLVERSHSNGVRELAQYDHAGRCVLKTSEGDHPEDSWTRRFVYSEDGDLVRRFDSQRGATAFHHDEGHRLARIELPDRSVESYRYDRADNLLEAPGLTAGLAPGNLLLSANGDRFDYDRRDHVSGRHNATGGTLYRYDDRDQLVSIEAPGLSYHATHDGLGRRTQKTVNGKTWTYYWDTDRLAAEIMPDGRTRIYVYPDAVALVPILFIDYDSAVADPASGKRYHVHADHLGCPELILDDAGRTVWRARIRAYGQAVVEVGADFHQPLRWPGHYFDAETGLHENRYRSYSPELGRYLQSDPDGIAGGLNLYAYTDNPLRSVDLDGLNKVCPDDKKEGCQDEEGGPDKEGTEPKPKMSDEDMQAAADLIHEAIGDEKAQKNRVTTVSELEDGRMAVTVSGKVTQDKEGRDRIIAVTPDQREAARALLGPDALMPDEPGNPAHVPPAQRPLSDPSGQHGDSAFHGEGKGAQVGDKQGSPVVRQTSSSSAEHGGAACAGCEKLQGDRGIANPTGAQSQGGRKDGGKAAVPKK